MPQPSVRTEYEKRLATLQDCLHQLQREKDALSLSQVVLNYLRTGFKFDLIWLAAYDGASSTLTELKGYTTAGKTNVLQPKQSVLPGDLFDQVLLTGQNCEIPDLQQESRAAAWQTVARRQNIQGTLILPIRYRQQALGVMVVGTSFWGGHPRPEELIELKLITDAFGAALLTLATAPQSAAAQNPDATEALLDGLGAIVEAQSFDACLKQVLLQTYQKLLPTRVCFYRIDPHQQLCQLHEVYAGEISRGQRGRSPVKVTVQLRDIAAFYQASLQTQIVAVGDAQSVMQPQNAPTRLMSLTQTRSWLSAAIMDRQHLIGFLAVESTEPRLWSETERQYMQLMAQFLSQSLDRVSPAEQGKSEQGQAGTASLWQAVEQDPATWDKTLQRSLEQIVRQMNARWGVIITYIPDEDLYETQAQVSQKKQHFPARLPALSAVDTKLLNRSDTPVVIQSLEDDLRLLNWRSALTDVGIRSCLLLKTDGERGLRTYFILASELPRTWTQRDLDTLTPLVETLGHSLNRRRNWLQSAQQQSMLVALKQGLTQMQQSRQFSDLCSSATTAIRQFLEVPCLIILHWTENDTHAEVVGYENQADFTLSSDLAIDWKTDRFIQSILTPSPEHLAEMPPIGFCHQSASELMALTQGWLTAAGGVHGVSAPLTLDAAAAPLGLVLALDRRSRRWSEETLAGFQFLVREFTAHCQTHIITQQLTQRQQVLESLNWYKQRQLEAISRLWTEQTAHLPIFDTVPTGRPAGLRGLKHTSQNPIDQLRKGFQSLDVVLKTEAWQLDDAPAAVPAATLLRRSLERIEPVVKDRQLWTQVHNLTTNVMLHAPAQKLELVLVELLLAACYRSKVGDRVDIWCRALQENWVELSITDQGRLNPYLVQALSNSDGLNLSNNAMLQDSPGVHFKVCRSLVESWKGRFELAQLEDGRALSRLILPLTA